MSYLEHKIDIFIQNSIKDRRFNNVVKNKANNPKEGLIKWQKTIK